MSGKQRNRKSGNKSSKKRRSVPPPPSSAPVVVNVEDAMRAIFDDSQRLDKHTECLVRLSCLQRQYTKNKRSIKEFYRELIRDVKYSLWVPDSRSPYTQNTIAFIVKYLLTFPATIEIDPTVNGRAGRGDDGNGGYLTLNGDNDELRHELINAILEDVVIPYTNSTKVECRLNSCFLIRLLSDELDDISEDMFEKIRKALLDRTVDKVTSVRAAAIMALHRFQDSSNDNDLVILAIHFHLDYDPDPEVRHNCLKSMAALQQSLTHFVGATRDVKDFIRKTAYNQIASKLQMKCFTIEQRLTILKNGLKDRSPAVRKVVESVLIPSWVKSCDNNLVQLLIALDIQTDIELIEKMLIIYFKHLLSEKLGDDDNKPKTSFHQLVEEFCAQNLTKERLFSVSLNVENIFLWRFLCEFCQSNKIATKDIKTNVSSPPSSPPPQPMTESNDPIDTTGNNTVSDDQFNVVQQFSATNDIDYNDNECQNLSPDESNVQNVDLFDLLVPEVPLFYSYLEKFMTNVIEQDLSMEDALDFEFIFNQFMKVSLLLDIGDEAQRKMLIKSLRVILMNDAIGYKFLNYVAPVMKCLARKGFTDNITFLDFTVEIISEIFNAIGAASDDLDSIAEETAGRELEDQKNKLIEMIDKLRIELQEMDGNDDERRESEKTQEINVKLTDCQQELNAIQDKISATNNISFSQSSQTSSLQISTRTSSLPSFTDHPKSLMRCLHMFSSCLEFSDFSQVNAVMQTHIEKVCLPGFLSDDVSVRRAATRCLGLVCLTCPQYFKKYLHLLIEIFLKDVVVIKMIALQSIFDSLCEHGINIFDDKKDKNGDKTEDNSYIRQLAFDDSDEDFITSLKQFFYTQLESDLFEIKQTAVQGVSKLLIHCRMYSPELLAKLILIWFTPDENQILVQFIGDFLRLYALAESQGVIVGQSAIEESFMITVQTLYDQRMKNINYENLIKFFLNLINDESHPKLATDLTKRMIDCEPQDIKFAEDYLLPAVVHLNLIPMNAKELNHFEYNMKIIVNKFESSKSKIVKKKLSTIMNRIGDRKELMTANEAFERDFEAIDDNDNDDEVLVEIGDQNTEANVDLNVGHDSDGGESFKTCPESQSPPQKKRRMTSDNENDFFEANDSELDMTETVTNETVEPVADDNIVIDNTDTNKNNINDSIVDNTEDNNDDNEDNIIDNIENDSNIEDIIDNAIEDLDNFDDLLIDSTNNIEEEEMPKINDNVDDTQLDDELMHVD
ncbi:condensin complex subunit 3-like [Oppia nitens]|uniref:condensin complex subunit 3-like n=1 Tax=Oppia nitens TaxID=1686743 RepID=UPI0023DB12A3|nr:condensin complex subunit 3-like [Oppia nitens]